MYRPHLYWLVIVLLIGCSPVGPEAATRPGGTAEAPERPKTITVAARNPVRAFGTWSISSTGGTFALNEIHSAPLVTTDLSGGYEARLLARLPSVDDGTLAVLPDGRMRVTWSLRPNVKWHDGTPFTADDIVFSRRVLAHPEIPLSRAPMIDFIERIDVPDPLTAVVTLSEPYFLPNFLGLRNFWVLPKHVLEQPFQGDVEVFINLPYWTTEYIHLGPFRLADYGLGEDLVFERFDDYFLGRPNVNRILVRVIPDENTLFANFQAGVVDLVPEQALSPDLFMRLREEWAQSGAGAVVGRQGTWRFLAAQFNPEWAQPLEVSRDVRVRQGLYHGFDGEALRETLYPGLGGQTDPASYMPKGEPGADVVGRPFARFRYDPSTAARLLAEAGWRRAGDGRLLNAAGDQVQIAIRTTPGYYIEGSIVAQYWRDLGIDVKEEQTPPALVRDQEYGAKFSGFEANANSSGRNSVKRHHSRERATPENRYAGRNPGYANPALDRVIDRLFATIEPQPQALLLKEIGEILATDLPVLPTYFQINLAAVRNGIRALVDDYAGADSPGLTSRNAHRWDRD
jgi:peptide/nickel transport system substrate-binding protein